MSAHRGTTRRLSIVLTICCILSIVVLFISSIETVQAKSKQRKQSQAETVLIVVRKKNEFPAIEVRELGSKKGRVPKRQSAPITASTKSSIIVDENTKTENTNQQGDKRRSISKKKKQVRKKAKQEAITLMEEGETLAAEVQAVVPSQPIPANSPPNKSLATKAELEYNTKGLIIAVSIMGGIILVIALIGIIAGVAVMVKQKRNYPSSNSGGCCGKLYDLLCCCRRAKSNYKKHDDYEESSNSGAILYHQDNDMKKQLLDKLEDYEM